MESSRWGKRQFLALLASFALLLTSPASTLCATAPGANILAPGCNKFGLQLLKNISKSKPGKNVLISGYSISEALDMAASGASGPTAREIYDAVVGTKRSSDLVDAAAKEIRDSLREAAASDKKVEINIANSIWVNERDKVKTDFANKCKTVYDALVKNVKMSGASEIINSWIANVTKDKITHLVDRLEEDTVAVLVNAVYFKGLWQSSFRKELTTDQKFFLTGSKSKTVKMMFKNDELGYYADNDSQTVALPYGQGRMRLLVMLPSKTSSTTALMEGLTEDRLAKTRRSFTGTKMNLYMPRFKVEFGVFLLNDALKQLGIKTCFTGNADFSKMCASKMVVSEVLHKAIMEVDEEGTVAAAATAIVTKRAMAEEERIIEMRVDRPFLVFIEDTKTNMILFSGVVNDPQ